MILLDFLSLSLTGSINLTPSIRKQPPIITHINKTMFSIIITSLAGFIFNVSERRAKKAHFVPQRLSELSRQSKLIAKSIRIRA